MAEQIIGPQLEAGAEASPLGELSTLANRQVWLTLGTATIGLTGIFTAYSYITPTLMQVTGEAALPVSARSSMASRRRCCREQGRARSRSNQNPKRNPAEK